MAEASRAPIPTRSERLQALLAEGPSAIRSQAAQRPPVSEPHTDWTTPVVSLYAFSMVMLTLVIVFGAWQYLESDAMHEHMARISTLEDELVAQREEIHRISSEYARVLSQLRERPQATNVSMKNAGAISSFRLQVNGEELTLEEAVRRLGAASPEESRYLSH